MQARIVDEAGIYGHCAFILLHQGGLRIDELLGDRILREQHTVAFEVDARVREQSLVACHLPFSLHQRGLERARIDFRQQLAFSHQLSFAKQHAHQLAVYAASDRHGL